MAWTQALSCPPSCICLILTVAWFGTLSTEQNRDRWQCSVVVRACREEGTKRKKAKKKKGNKRGQDPAAPQGGGTEKDEWLGPGDGPR